MVQVNSVRVLNSKIPVILMGMPYSHLILDTRGNEQLRRRFSLRRSIQPFSWSGEDKEQKDFRNFLRLVDENLPFNKRANLAGKTMAYRFYCATNGVISYVMDIVRMAALTAIELSLETIDSDLLTDAYDRCLASAYPDRDNPFRCEAENLTILPFADWLPKLRNLKELNDEGVSASEILRRK